MTRPGPEGPARVPALRSELQKLAGAALAGALFVGAGAAALGLTLDLLSHRWVPARATAQGLREFLNAGGWVRLPLWGAALGALRALGWARLPRARALALLVACAALAFAALPGHDLREAAPPGASDASWGGSTPTRGPPTRRGAGSGSAAKSIAIRRGAYASADGVRGILALRADPNPVIREQVALALGVNLIVSDIEHAASDHPSRYATQPVRDSLRGGLLGLLRDSVEAVRAEAARALWKAPLTFGVLPAAAETLAAVLARVERPGTPERLAWLALDAAAGAPHPGLKRAAARFAATTTDSELGRAARIAAGQAPRSRGRP